MSSTPAACDDLAVVTELLGRTPEGEFTVVLRRSDGRPVVIENEPNLRDGTPMPTLYWLVDLDLKDAVSRVEANGGVHRFEDLVDPEHLRATHESYMFHRTQATRQNDAIAPTGGVGGTARGVKCLHAHLANWLAGNDDPVGELVAGDIGLSMSEFLAL